ncbi:hypothetical protein ElyMa_003901500, partial [Elysia marginata]
EHSRPLKNCRRSLKSMALQAVIKDARLLIGELLKSFRTPKLVVHCAARDKRNAVSAV